MLILRVAVILLLIWTAAEADIYKYVGEDGVVFYTDAPTGKKSEKIIKEKMSYQEKAKIKAGKTNKKFI